MADLPAGGGLGGPVLPAGSSALSAFVAEATSAKEARRAGPRLREDDEAEVFHSDAFEMMNEEEFHAREKIKLCAHNGLHLYLGLMGTLHGVKTFSELAKNRDVMSAAGMLLHHELAPALWRECCTHVERTYFDDYMEKLLPRLISPTLNDTIARAVRGLPDKLAPNERIMGGLRLLLRTETRPHVFIDLVAAAIAVMGKGKGGHEEEYYLGRLPEEMDVAGRVRKRWQLIKNQGLLNR